MRLRVAIPADQALLERWDQEPHVVESDPDDDWSWETELGREPPWREQLVAELLEGDGAWRPIGVVQIIDPALEESHYWGACEPNLRAIDIWIGEAHDLGRGHGTEMMRLALARCFASPEVSAVIIDPLASNLAAIRFYQRLGFVAEGERDFGADHCLVLRLTRAAWRASPGAGEQADP